MYIVQNTGWSVSSGSYLSLCVMMVIELVGIPCCISAQYHLQLSCMCCSFHANVAGLLESNGCKSVGLAQPDSTVCEMVKHSKHEQK